MSVSNVQEMRKEVNQLRNEIRDAERDVLKYQAALSASLSLMHRLGLPPEIDNAMSKIQRMIMLANQARIAMQLFYAASGPLGWFMFGLSAAGTLLTAGDMFVEASSH